MAKNGWLGPRDHGFGEMGDRLQALCAACVEDAGVDGAGLALLARDGTPETVHATNDVAARVEDLQFTLGEGPCVDAAKSRAAVLIPSLADGERRHRWPTFEREASVAGVGAIFAFPIMLGETLLGTLDLHRTTSGGLSPQQLSAARATVETAAWMMIALTSDAFNDAVPETTYRMVVHQAAGMVMMQLDNTIEEALLRLRAIAYAEDRPLHDLAADIVSRRRRLSREAE